MSTASPKGLFISFEGIDGAGKSSHIEGLAQAFRDQGRVVTLTREPGGTPLGEKLRELLLHEAMHLETETLLMFAARREHIAQVILPALARGEVVISDRFTDATFAYQGGGRGVAFDKITQLERWVQGDLQPDFTLLFDVPLDVARARLTQRAAQMQEALDKFEQESFEFFKRTREAYLQRAAQSPQRMAVIDSTRSLNEVKAQIRAAIVARPQLQLTIE